MKTVPPASKQPQLYENEPIVQSPGREGRPAAQGADPKTAISHFRRVVNRPNEPEPSSSPQGRGALSGIRASARSGGSGQYLPTEMAHGNADDEGPGKGMGLICSPSPRQQASPYHWQLRHRATNSKRPRANYEGEVLSSSNPDPVETLGADESSMQHDDHEGYRGDHSGEQYVGQRQPQKKHAAYIQSATDGLRSSHQHGNGFGGGAARGHPGSNAHSQRGRWQRSPSNPADRHPQHRNDDYEDHEEAYSAKKPRGTAEISTMQNHQTTEGAQSEE